MVRRSFIAAILALPWVQQIAKAVKIPESMFVQQVDGKCPDNYVYSQLRDHCVPTTGVCRGFLWKCTEDHHPFFICDEEVFPNRPERCCRKNRLGYKEGNCHGWEPKKIGVVE